MRRQRLSWLLFWGTLAGVTASPSVSQSPEALPGTFRASTAPADEHERPAVASAADGDFVVVWAGRRDFLTGEPGELLARRYDGEGHASGPAFRVNTVSGSAHDPVVASDAAGNFAVAWSQDGDAGDAILVRIFDADGAPLGEEIVAGTRDSRLVSNLALGRGAGGDFVVVWGVFEEPLARLFARSFDPSGNPRGEAFEVDPSTPRVSSSGPAVAVAEDGSFLVVWNRRAASGEARIVGRRFDREGDPLGGRFRVSVVDDVTVSHAAVFGGPDGAFVAAWSRRSRAEPRGDTALVVRPFAADAAALAGEIEVTRGSGLARPVVAREADGDFLVVWRQAPSFSVDWIYAGHFSATGIPRDGPFPVVQRGSREFENCAVAVDAGGTYVVTFLHDRFDVRGRRLPPSMRGGTLHVNPSQSFGDAIGVTEGGITASGEPAEVTVWRTGGSDGEVSVDYLTVDGAAAAREDYVPLSGTLTFADGEWAPRQVGIQVVDDDRFEDSEHEDFSFALSDPLGAASLTEPARARIEIYDDEFAPPDAGPPAAGPSSGLGGGPAAQRRVPVLSRLARGGFVLAWEETRADGETRVVARLHGDDGAPRSAPVVVLRAGQPAVAPAPDGGFSLAWHRAGSIHLRRFDAEARAVGPPTTVVARYFDDGIRTGFSMSNPRLARLADGGDAVLWLESFQSSHSAGSQCRWRRAEAGGELGAVKELVTFGNPTTCQDPIYAVAAEPDGGVLAAFIAAGGFQVQRFAADLEPLGASVVIDAVALLPPDLALTPGGGVIVAWERPDGAGVWTDVFFRRLASDLTPLGPAIRANRSTARDQARPAVAVDAAGNFLVVWQSRGQDGDGWGVYGRRFDARGESLGGEFRVNDVVEGDQSLPRAWSDPQGNLIVFWQDSRDPGEAGIRWRRFLASACAAGERRLCLQDGRFAVEVTWRDFQGRTGAGHGRAVTPDTGTFWFFSEDNLELMVKVLDGTRVNGHFWVFYGSLSNVEFSLRVTDTASGLTRTYANAAGRFASAGDVTAFRQP